MITRRTFLGTSLGAGAGLAFTPDLLRAFQQSAGTLIQRAIPSSGEKLPVLSFNPQQESDNAGMKDILKTLLDNGGSVVGMSHGGGEPMARSAAGELGIQHKFFWPTTLNGAPPRAPSDPPPPKADAAAVRAQIETKLAGFKVPKTDLVLTGAYARSEERRVGKEWRSWWAADD